MTAEVTIPAATVGADLTAFPVMVRLAHLPPSFWATVRANGEDIRAYAADGTTRLPLDVARVDYYAQDGVVFVKADVAAAADTVLFLTADGTSAAVAANDTYGRDNVWAAYDCVVLFGASRDDRTGKGGPGSLTATSDSVAGPLCFEKVATTGDINAHQGVCWGRVAGTGFYFVADDNKLTKYDETWTQVAQTTDPIGDAGLTASGANHCGDPEFKDGLIYVPVETYPSGPYVNQWVAVFSAADLSFVTKFDISAGGHEVSGIAYNPEDGLMYVTSYENDTTVYKYNATTFAAAGTLTLSAVSGLGNIQGIVYFKGRFLLSSDQGTGAGSDFIYQVTLAGVGQGTVFRAVTSGNVEGLSRREDAVLLLVDHGATEEVQTWVPRDHALAAGGGLGIAADGFMTYAGRPSRTTYTVGVTGNAAVLTGSNRALLSYWREAAGATDTRMTLGYRSATPEFALWDVSNSWLSASPVFLPVVGTPFRAHAVYEGTTRRRLYVNGTLRNTAAPITAVPSTLDTLRFGSEDASNNERWNGQVGFAYLHPAALSADWVAAEYANLADPAAFYDVAEAGGPALAPLPVAEPAVPDTPPWVALPY